MLPVYSGSMMDLIRKSAAALLFGLNTLVHVPVLLAAALVKALLPFAAARRRLNYALTSIAESWIAVNTWMITTFTHTRFEVSLPPTLRHDGHYLVLANHQSWVDIPVLQATLNRKIPLLRFFLKSQLFWVPFLGLAWWALDFPFMKRYSRETLAKRPHLAGRDIAATRRSCAKFANVPVSVMNFVEGTRFTPYKHDKQASPFKHLLKPKAGGVAFVLDAMGSCFHSLLDITIVYPHGRPTFADLFGNRIPLVQVMIRQREIPTEMLAGKYETDEATRARIQSWINDMWREKDDIIHSALAAQGNEPRR